MLQKTQQLGKKDKIILQAIIQKVPPRNEELTFQKPFFNLSPYENITEKLPEHKMDQLLKEAPEPLRNTKTTLIKNMTGGLSSGKILLEGPTGSGKTSLAYAIAYKCKAPYIFIRGSRLANSFKNSAPEFIEALFKALRTDHRNALIIDEFTAFTAKATNHNDADTGAVEDFWMALDQHREKYNLIFMATTNEIDKIPGPLRDRFGETHHIENPSKALRLLILKDSPLVSTFKYELEKLATYTDGFSLRDLELLYRKAVDYANAREPDTKQNTPITFKDIDKALEYVRKTSHIKAKDIAEKSNNQKLENFNRYRLPIILAATGTGLTIAGLVINYVITERYHAESVATQKTQHQDMIKLNEDHHRKNLDQQDKFHQDNLAQQDKFHKDNLARQDKFHQETLSIQRKHDIGALIHLLVSGLLIGLGVSQPHAALTAFAAQGLYLSAPYWQPTFEELIIAGAKPENMKNNIAIASSLVAAMTKSIR